MREIIECWERLMEEHGDHDGFPIECFQDGVEIDDLRRALSALRAGQALADAWRGMDLDPRTETFWKYTEARDAVLAAFPGEETTG